MLGAEKQTHKQASRPHVIAVTSGKGGVGKSSIAVNLGLSLVKSGARVCILDADTGLANVNILLGINPEYRLDHVLFGARTIEEVLVDGPLGMKVIPGANGISECVSLHPRQQLRLTRELARIESMFDYLLVDTAAGIAETTLDFVSAAHQTILVITPEPTSLTDAFSLVKLLARRRQDLTFQVVVNMCSGVNEARQVFHRFSAAVEKYIGLRVQLLGSIQRDESLRSAVTLQSPVAMYPDSDPSSRSFVRLADSLRERLTEVTAPTSFTAYWQQHYREAAAEADSEADENLRHDLEGGADQTSRRMSASPPEHRDRNAGGRRDERDATEVVLERDLAQWEQRWRELVAGDELPRELLAGALVACHEVFWQRFEQPALALPALLARLADEPERNAALLAAVRAALPADPLHSVAGPADCRRLADAIGGPELDAGEGADGASPASHRAARSGAAVLVAPSPATRGPVPTAAAKAPLEAPPLSGLFAALPEAGTGTTAPVLAALPAVFSTPPPASATKPGPDPGSTGRSREIIHAYDESRFGSQAHLADLLQRQGERGKTVMELIEALV